MREGPDLVQIELVASKIAAYLDGLSIGLNLAKTTCDSMRESFLKELNLAEDNDLEGELQKLKDIMEEAKNQVEINQAITGVRD